MFGTRHSLVEVEGAVEDVICTLAAHMEASAHFEHHETDRDAEWAEADALDKYRDACVRLVEMIDLGRVVPGKIDVSLEDIARHHLALPGGGS